MVLQTLASRRILSAPVLSDDQEICGFLDIRDILSSFLDGALAACPFPPHMSVLTLGQRHRRRGAGRNIAGQPPIRIDASRAVADVSEGQLQGKMLQRMRVLEDAGVRFTAKPVHELSTMGGDGGFLHAAQTSSGTVLELVLEGFLHPKEARRCASSSRTRAWASLPCPLRAHDHIPKPCGYT